MNNEETKRRSGCVGRPAGQGDAALLVNHELDIVDVTGRDWKSWTECLIVRYFTFFTFISILWAGCVSVSADHGVKVQKEKAHESEGTSKIKAKDIFWVTISPKMPCTATSDISDRMSGVHIAKKSSSSC